MKARNPASRRSVNFREVTSDDGFVGLEGKSVDQIVCAQARIKAGVQCAIAGEARDSVSCDGVKGGEVASDDNPPVSLQGQRKDGLIHASTRIEAAVQ